MKGDTNYKISKLGSFGVVRGYPRSFGTAHTSSY